MKARHHFVTLLFLLKSTVFQAFKQINEIAIIKYEWLMSAATLSVQGQERIFYVRNITKTDFFLFIPQILSLNAGNFLRKKALNAALPHMKHHYLKDCMRKANQTINRIA